MSLSYCVGLVYRHPVLVVRGVELSNDVEADALVKLSFGSRTDRYIWGPIREPGTSQPHESSKFDRSKY